MFENVRHVILDRDGVLNMERAGGCHVVDWSQWRWIPRAIEGLGVLRSMGIHISVATNQSSVARGLVSRSTLDAIHAQMVNEAVRGGGAIDKIFVCPHAASEGCGCRKPAPGLVFRAVEESKLPLSETILVGDDVRDIEAAAAAKIPAALVRTGKGGITETTIAGRGVPAFDDLMAFAARVRSDLLMRSSESR